MRPLASTVLLLFNLTFAAAVHAAEQPVVFEAKVRGVMIDPTTETPVVILETIADQRRLPIWIDVPEARAIAMELEGVKPPRPLTHDLIQNILKSLDATLQSVTITEVRNNTYFAILSLTAKGQKLMLDGRPSDAIAIALRAKAPIYASAQVLESTKAATRPPARAGQSQRKLGIQVQELTEELASLMNLGRPNGILVADVTADSTAAKSGLQRGDIIAKINDQVTSSAADLESVLATENTAQQVRLEVIRKGKAINVVIDLSN